MELTKREIKLLEAGYTLDTHSTFLSRKNCYHVMVGRKRYVKVKKVRRGA